MDTKKYFRPLLDLLLEYKPLNDDEYKDLEHTIAFVRKYGDKCFCSDFIPGHITGSAWIENVTGDKFLLTLHKKLKHWLQLGGHADGDTDILNVVYREIYEESGLKQLSLLHDGIFDISIHRFSEKGQPEHLHYDIRFLLKTMEPDDSIKISNESLDLKWFQSLPEKNFPEMVRMFQKWQVF